MRVSSSQFHLTVNNTLTTANSKLAKLMENLGSGSKINLPSDNPINHIRVSRLQRDEININQYLDNIASLSNKLTNSENILDGIQKNFSSLRDILIWALDGTNTPEDLNSMASSLEGFRDTLLADIQTKDKEGNYIFSGTDLKNSPIKIDNQAEIGKKYSFGGNTQLQKVIVGNGVEQPANITLEKMSEYLNIIDLGIDALKQGKSSSDSEINQKLKDSLNVVDLGVNEVLQKIASLGNSQNLIESLSLSFNKLSVANKEGILDYAQLNYTEAATQMHSLSSAITATQNAYKNVSKLSLFNIL